MMVCIVKECKNDGTDKFVFEDSGEYCYLCLDCIKSILYNGNSTIKEALEMDWIDDDTAKKLKNMPNEIKEQVFIEE